MRRSLSERVLRRLEVAERAEINPHWRDDYRIAWITVLYAAQGNQQPHVDATYRVLGLHPDKVWLAIVAHNKARLGPEYGNFFAEFLPRKKPAQSASIEAVRIRRYAAMEGSLKTRSAEDDPNPRRLKVVETPPKMASTARAYLNSDASSSAKSRGFTRADLEGLFEECDLPRHLVNFITGAWRASGKPSGAEVFFFATVEGYRIEGRYRSERTVRYNLRKCEQLGILEKVYAPNSWIRANYYRHTATHRLNISALKRRQTYQHFKNNRPVAQPLPPQSAKVPTMPAAPEAPQAAPIPITPAPTNAPVRPEHRQLGRHTRRDCAKLIALTVQLMRGNTLDGFGHKLSPGGPPYRAPMSRDAAIEAACRSFNWTVESAVDAMKFHGFSVASEGEA